MITGALKNKIDSIWNIFWSNGMTNPLTVIEQITYLMFLKILDEKEAGNGISFIPPEYNHCRWRVFSQYEPEKMFRNMMECVFPFMKEYLATENSPYAKYLKDAVFLIPSSRVLTRVVEALDNLDLHNKDMMGDMYEYLLSQIAKSGTNGQFRTPRHIINLIVELVQPNTQDIICDPAMGTAGFLCAAAQNLPSDQLETSRFYGFDTDQTMLRIGAMNMMLHGITAPNIEWMDALSDTNTYRDTFSLIMANPPFTGTLDQETVSSDLCTIADTRKTELLFLSLFLRMLKPGGRCAVIVPEGVLFGASKAHTAIRKELVEHHHLKAVIAMPSGVFKPYAGVSTAILIFAKTGCGGTENIWFYDMETDGYSLDDKRSPLAASDIPDIINRFQNLDLEKTRKRTDQSFFVPRKEIAESGYDLSVNKYRKNKTEKIQYPPTSEILERLHILQQEIAVGLQELEALLHE